ncbi:hypothetical protein FACS189490_00610 [Clostridia bacterium]|nr:hypothetical protein FACS189490_00610 [Clostridia bacterium]
MKKRTGIALTLALTMLAGTISACGSKTESPTNPPANSATQAPAATDAPKAADDTPAENAATEAPTEETAPAAAYDFGGYHFTFASPWAQDFIGGDDGQTEQQELFTARIKEIEQNYNCTIEVVKIGENTNELLMTSINANEKFADFVDTNAVNFYALKASKMLYNISSISAFDPTGDSVWNTGMTKIDTFDDGTYGVWQSDTNKMVMWINDSFRQRLGLESIDDLIAKGEWNWEKYLEYAQAATKDIDQDGNNDTYGIIAMGDALGLSVLNSNNAPPAIFKDGKYQYNGTSPEVIASIDFYADLVGKSKVVMPPVEGNWDTPINLFIQGNTLFFPYNDWCAGGYLNPNMEDDFILRPLPLGPNAKEFMSWCTDYRTFAMPVNVPEPETAMIIFDAMFQPLPGYGKEDEAINMVLMDFRDEASVEWKIGLRDNMEMMYLFPTVAAYYEYIWHMDNVANGEATAAAEMEAIKDTMQTALDDTYRQ